MPDEKPGYQPIGTKDADESGEKGDERAPNLIWDWEKGYFLTFQVQELRVSFMFPNPLPSPKTRAMRSLASFPVREPKKRARCAAWHRFLSGNEADIPNHAAKGNPHIHPNHCSVHHFCNLLFRMGCM